ncbi:MAG: anthranilate synthase component I family protein [Pseudomonadota bacterium]|nr:anthranilate synthase component I family protein [Pseudomonadota bacterium]
MTLKTEALKTPFTPPQLWLSALKEHLRDPIHALISQGSGERSRFSYICGQSRSIVSLKRNFSDPNAVILTALDQMQASKPAAIMGYISYPHNEKASNCSQLPSIDIRSFDWQLVFDHHAQRIQCQFSEKYANSTELLKKIQQIASALANISSTTTNKARPLKRFFIHDDFKPLVSKSDYQAQFDAIQSHILAGDIYQINLTLPFQTQYQGLPLHGFELLLEHVDTPYCAYYELESHTIMSFSPEEFIQTRGSKITTSPIKGTIARALDNVLLDQANKEKLKASTKDRAEHIMIVDLLRNDLGKICESGTVAVNNLLNIESFSNVHHLVTQVEGRLLPDISPAKALLSCFPGGSITGAPKIKAMEIIHELEPFNREVYCGSIFHFNAQGDLSANIPIRTLVAEHQEQNPEQGKITCWSGGGVVADSTWQSEYQEAVDKVNHLLSGLKR